jgi:hypothetical protein
MNHYIVGDVVDPRNAYDLPRGAAIKRSESGQFVITELPERTPVQVLRDDLVAAEYDDMGPTELAEWILKRFDQETPDVVFDTAGDRWERQSDGTYTYFLTRPHRIRTSDPAYHNWTLTKLREMYSSLTDADGNEV